MTDSPAKKTSLAVPLSLASLLVLIVSFAARRAADSDLWFDLAAGRSILGGSFTYKNFLSFTEPDHIWFNTHWLYDVFMYAVIGVGGVSFGVIAKIAVWVAVFVVLWFAVDGSKRPGVAGFGLALAAFVSADRMGMRSEMLSYLFAAIYIFILKKWTNDDKRKYLRLLIPLQLLWSNSHAYWIFGLVILFFNVVGVWAGTIRLPFEWNRSVETTPAVRKELTIVAVLCCAVTILNPYGIDGVLYPFGLVGAVSPGNIYREITAETLGPFKDWAFTRDDFIFAYILSIVIFGLSTLRNAKRLSISDFATAFLFLAYSLSSRRGVGAFAIVSAPVIIDNLGFIFARFRERWFAYVQSALCVGLAAFTFTGGLWRANLRPYEVGIGMSRFFTPTAAVDFIKKNKPSGNVFNSLTWGAYLAYEGNVKIFMGDLFEAAFSEALLYEYLSILNDPSKLPSASMKYDLGWAMLNQSTTFDHTLISALAKDPAWKLVYLDWNSIIFVRRQGNEHIAELNLAVYNGDLPANIESNPYAVSAMGMAFQLIGKPSIAAIYYDKAVRSFPKDATSANLYGKMLFANGSTAEGISSLERAARLAPRHMPFRYDLATALLMDKKYAEAIAILEKYVKKIPDHPDARINLAGAYLGAGRKADAIAQYEAALKLNPGDERVVRALEYLRNQ